MSVRKKLKVSVIDIGKTTTVYLSGSFSFEAQRQFESACKSVLNNSTVERIVINFAEVEYLDSSALGMLLVLRNQALAANKSLLLASPSEMTLQVFNVACFQKLFEIE